MGRVTSVAIVLTSLITFQLGTQVRAEIAPEARPMSAACKASEAWKSKKSRSQVCVDMNGKWRWVKTLDKKSAMALAQTCSPFINERDRATTCRYFEDLTLYVAGLSLPKARCLTALQQVLAKLAEIYNTESGKSSQEISAEVGKIIVAEKCARVF